MAQGRAERNHAERDLPGVGRQCRQRRDAIRSGPAALHPRAVAQPDMVEAKRFRLLCRVKNGSEVRLSMIIANERRGVEQQAYLH